jgi:hypothetical protein
MILWPMELCSKTQTTIVTDGRFMGRRESGCQRQKKKRALGRERGVCRGPTDSLFGWLVADGWCCSVVKEE